MTGTSSGSRVEFDHREIPVSLVGGGGASGISRS
jgi:hypothetical protein